MNANIPAIEFEIERLQKANASLAERLAAAEARAEGYREALEGIRAGVGMARQAGVSNGILRTIEKIADDALAPEVQQ